MKTNKKGSSLILIMIIVAVVTMTSSTIYYYTSNSSYANRKTISSLKARSISEAGLTIAYNQLKNNMSLTNSNWSLSNFDEGTYQIYFYSISSNLMNLVSVGIFNGISIQTSVNLHFYPSGSFTIGGNNGETIYGPYSYNYVLYIGGSCDWSGCGTFNGGSIYVSGPISLKGNASWGNSTGTLNISSSTSIDTQGSANITATAITSPSISGSGISAIKTISTVTSPILPTIELGPFYQTALINKQIVTGNVSIVDGFIPVGGVLWCEGSLDFKGNAKGCFISTLGAYMESQANISPYNPNWPTIYNKLGDITIAGQANINGFVYTGGNINFTGGGEFHQFSKSDQLLLLLPCQYQVFILISPINRDIYPIININRAIQNCIIYSHFKIRNILGKRAFYYIYIST